MGIVDGIIGGFATTLTPEVLFFCLLGSIIGTATGVLPGIGPLAAISILMPITLSLPPVPALAMLCAVFYGAMYGGSTTSILLRMPGEAAAVVVTLDGHSMAQQGRAGVALGISAIASFLAGTFGIIALTFFAPLLGSLALRFGPPEYCAVILLSFVAVTFMVQGPPVKAALMIALGIFCSSIGIDGVTGEQRFTFGSTNLTAGFPIVAVVVGMFGLAEILERVEKLVRTNVDKLPIGRILPTLKDWADSTASILRGTIIGFVMGVLPGAGPVSAAFTSYAVERRAAPRPERFGKGAIEGVAGPEAANSAAVAGAMIPLLSLGVPANAVMAVLLGALVIQGIQPGPMMIIQRPDVFWGVIASMYVGNVMLLILNLPLIGIWVQMLRVPYRVLFPCILLLAAIGAFSENNNLYGIWVMIGFGVAGYLLRKLNYELAPFILAMVLSPLLEQSLRQSLIMSREGPLIFVTRPISGVLVAISVAILAMLVIKQFKKGENAK